MLQQKFLFNKGGKEMRKLWNARQKTWIRYSQSVIKVLKKKDGFGRDEILGTVAILIIAAFVTIPFLQDFATDVVDKMNDWWTDTISAIIFPESL
jgi:hypothetical protein